MSVFVYGGVSNPLSLSLSLPLSLFLSLSRLCGSVSAACVCVREVEVCVPYRDCVPVHVFETGRRVVCVLMSMLMSAWEVLHVC